ncbi:hypothetical protein QJS10_CPB20g01622 [Acorus calamus]|uniref:Uncharacterized protein n=1 Tax=Acorus calamus TaxID=4465 RepID=A0AAV9CC48_ACOCL|nr:hypothetical protein QJS10_CPB20g01622 [Acorus calamus]
MAGFMLRVRMASFFAGAATASAAGLFFLYKDYKLAHESLSLQVKSVYNSLDGRISALEKLKEVETPTSVEGIE